MLTFFKNSFTDPYLWIGTEKSGRMWPILQGCGFHCLPRKLSWVYLFLLWVSWAVNSSECSSQSAKPYLSMHWSSPRGLWTRSPPSWSTNIPWPTLRPWEQTEVHVMVAFCWLGNQKGFPESREAFLYSWSCHVSCLCCLTQAEIPILSCSMCKAVGQKEPLWVSLALCQPCFGATPLWSVLSSVQPKYSPALHQLLWSCWQCIHPNPNSSGTDTLLVHTEHFPKQGHGMTLFPKPQDEVKGIWGSFLFINGEQGSRHLYWKEDLTTGTPL